MMVGLDRKFKPKWVYRILQRSKPGLEFKELEPEFLDIIEYPGSRMKINVLKVIKRYYLLLDKKNGKYYFSDNYLHNLSISHSYESIKPLLLFVLIFNSPIAQFLQNKINKLFGDKNEVDSKILLKHTKKYYGDRRIVSDAVTSYLSILNYFDILDKEKTKYYWKNRILEIPDHILKEKLILYAHLRDDFEIDINRIQDDIAFSMFNLENLESVLMEYNSIEWAYQKRMDSKKIIITKKYKKT